MIGLSTAPASRGRGYGRAVVSFVTRSILEAGSAAALTYREENAAMCRIADALGYTPR